MNLHLTKQPVKVSKNITFLGEIPMMNDFERRHTIGVIEESERYEDYVMDDSAIVYQERTVYSLSQAVPIVGYAISLNMPKRYAMNRRLSEL